MGMISSRQNAGVEEVDISVNHAYRYPPKSAGNYFSNHFIMGGERFDTAQPEMYLFGENSDLNFLGSRPAPFPYPAPSASEPSRTLKALVNIRKESLRFVRVPDNSLSLKEPETRSTSTHFNVEFTFDCDVRCAITIMYFCTEELSPSGLIYTPKDLSMNSETYHYKCGANQQFSQVCHIFDPSQYSDDELGYSFDKEVMPIVIICEAEEGEDIHQVHSTIAVVEKHADGYTIKPLKQKLFVDGLCYLLQEIYGIENKNADISKVGAEDDTEDNGAECVICMCDLRDTLILPCRHLCLCNCCADSLRYQANNCPICRAPFRALLQIKALQKLPSGAGNGTVTASNEAVKGTLTPPSTERDPLIGGVATSDALLHACFYSSTEGIPNGYQAVPLIEALNGPSVAPQQPVAPPYQDISLQDNFESRVKLNGLEDSTTQTEHSTSATDSNGTKSATNQMRMSVLLAQESTEDSTLNKLEVSSASSPPATGGASLSHKKRKSRFLKEDSVSSVNETSTRTKEFSDALGSRKLRKSISSPVSPAEAREASKTSAELDDNEESHETLSLLDSLQGCSVVDATNPASSSASDIKAMSPSLSSALKIRSDSCSLEEGIDPLSYPDEHDVSSILDEDYGGTCGVDADLGTDRGKGAIPASTSFERENISKEFNVEGQLTKTGRGSKKGKNKQRRSSSRRSRGSIGSVHNQEGLGIDDTNSSLALESHSLPGTPLSTSSAVSRTSDVSVSSASSTRALIMSQPPSKAASTAI